MSFRWREEQDVLVVRHVLEDGSLTVVRPVGVSVTARYVTRVVERGLLEGWRPHEHHRLELTDDEQRALADEPGATAPPRASASLDQEEQLLAPSPLPGAGLRAVLLPPGTPALVLTGSLEASTLEVVGWVGDERRAWRGPVDAEALQDLLVMVWATPEAVGPGEGPSCPGRVRLAGGRGTWTFDGDVAAAGSRARVAAVGLWRLARGLGDGPTPVLEGAQVALRPIELPFRVDRATRTLHLFGRWASGDLERVLRGHPGPWTIDARGLLAVEGIERSLRGWLRFQREVQVWLGDVDRLRGLYLGLRITADPHQVGPLLEEGARELLEEVLLKGIEPHWMLRAGEAFTAGADRLDDLGDWLAPSWSPAAAPVVAGWHFEPTFRGWVTAVPACGLVIGPRRAWAVVAGRVVTLRLR